MGAAVLPLLLPGLVAAAIGYLIFVGLGDWSGLDAPGLQVPAIPPYASPPRSRSPSAPRPAWRRRHGC